MSYHPGSTDANLVGMGLSVPAADTPQHAAPAIRYPVTLAIAQLEPAGYPTQDDPLHPVTAHVVDSDRMDDHLATLSNLMWVKSVNKFTPKGSRHEHTAQPVFHRYEWHHPQHPPSTRNFTRETLLAELRSSGAELALLFTTNADMTRKDHVPIVSLLTLGIAPTSTDTATVTGFASLIDTQTGYVYATPTHTDDKFKIRNYHGGDKGAAADYRATEKVEEALFNHFKKIWPDIIKQYPPTN